MKRFASTLIVAAALVVAAVGVPTTASAATKSTLLTTESVRLAAPPSRDAGGILVTTPPAPRNAQVALANPTTSPSVRNQTVLPGGTYTCPYGYFCAQVWDVITWKVFFFYDCQIYDVFNWTGTGYWRNNQTKAAPTPYLLGYDGAPYYILAKSPSSGSVNWDPVYSVSPCY